MSNDSTPEIADDADVVVQIRLYPEDSPEKALRQIGYGIAPFVMLEAEPQDDGSVALVVVGSLIDDLDELVQTLEGFTEAVRDAVAQHKANEVAATAEDGS